MNAYSKIIFTVLALMYLVPAHAAFHVDGDGHSCRVFAEDDADGGKKDADEGKEKDGEKEEEEPDCE